MSNTNPNQFIRTNIFGDSVLLGENNIYSIVLDDSHGFSTCYTFFGLSKYVVQHIFSWRFTLLLCSILQRLSKEKCFFFQWKNSTDNSKRKIYRICSTDWTSPSSHLFFHCIAIYAKVLIAFNYAFHSHFEPHLHSIDFHIRFRSLHN